MFILERSNGTNNWNTFHTAAESVTMLYKGNRCKIYSMVCWGNLLN